MHHLRRPISVGRETTTRRTASSSTRRLIDVVLKVVERKTSAGSIAAGSILVPIGRIDVAVRESTVVDERLGRDTRRLLVLVLIVAMRHERLRKMRRGGNDARDAMNVLREAATSPKSVWHARQGTTTHPSITTISNIRSVLVTLLHPLIKHFSSDPFRSDQSLLPLHLLSVPRPSAYIKQRHTLHAAAHHIKIPLELDIFSVLGPLSLNKLVNLSVGILKLGRLIVNLFSSGEHFFFG